MRYYRYAGIAVLALAAVLFGTPTVVAIATPKPQIINTTFIQPPPHGLGRLAGQNRGQ